MEPLSSRSDHPIGPQIWWLETTTWRGISIGARHYYGTVRASVEHRRWRDNDGDERWRVERAVDRAGLRDVMGLKHFKEWMLEPGETTTTECFNTEQDVVEAAILRWRIIADPGDELWWGEYRPKLIAVRTQVEVSS